jgi:hypothetical protein
MAEVVAVQIGGLRLRARSIDPTLSLTLAGATALFRYPGEQPDVDLTVRRAPQTTRVEGRLVFRSGGLWDLWEHQGELLFRLSSPVMGEVPYKTARFDAAFTRGRIEVDDRAAAYGPAVGPLDPFEYPLDELVCVHWLAQGRGVELHAAGIVDERGVGRLFVGHSGAGKTTVCGLWGEAGTVLSDDRIIVRLEEGRPFMYGTPWHGEARLSSPGRAPLEAIYLLQQAETAALVPLPAAVAAARLFACSFVPAHHRPGVEASLALLDALVQRVPCRELHFRRDSALGSLGL